MYARRALAVPRRPIGHAPGIVRRLVRLNTTMSSYRPTRGVVPPSGVYLVLWLDPVKTVQHFDDPNLQAAARQLSPGKILIFLYPIAHGIGVSYDSLDWSVDYGDAWEISVVDRQEHRCYMNEDQRKRNILIEQASPPAKIELVPSTPGSIVEVTSDTVVDANGVVKVEDWLKTTGHSQEPLEELAADNDISSEVSGDDTPDSLPDDDVSPSTPYSDDDANSMDTVDLFFESLFAPNFSHIDVDVIPLVDFSFDLTEVKEVLDPRGFLEEVEAMAELIRRFRAGMLIDVPDSHALPDHPMVSHPDDHTISLDIPTTASPADPSSQLPTNSIVALTSHPYGSSTGTPRYAY
ncbi:predicted protein [Postia placenta Mad-698-R]|uniref:Uncharacterized protein n=1 Tax=Postia placenta MAD-698-R-SB12 TaxID=670580 RepID=A0A1X6N4N1_9APHY|nr:hypothetical protein POSPLADRAFT_1139342 [Postia placenta MAD-698-R-SB12]EED80651.1 predicted protein [Postia placenta Mad-698-R]OSX63393.1 hypothetical protein POSPLADRAFT_1139342 [Postia placenta MAD-698-R-SB12]